MTADETSKRLKGAKTDSDRVITYEPEARPEVANLLLLISLCEGVAPEQVALHPAAGQLARLRSSQPVIAAIEPLAPPPVWIAPSQVHGDLGAG